MPEDPISTKGPLKAQIHALCPHCAAGHAPVWQRHSREFVHRRSTQVRSGTSWSITLCGANAIRKAGAPS